MNPLISVIIPVYNVQQYLDRCLQSIVHQTYQNLEIILVDDGSTDNSGNLCDSYAAEDARIQVIHQENGGLSHARNEGIRRASGEWIGFIDSDDWAAPDMIESLYEGAVFHNADISICGFYVVKGNIIEADYREEDIVLNRDDAILELLKDKTIQNYAWNKLYRSYLFTDVEFPRGRHFEDVGTTYKTFLKANTIAVLSCNKYYYYRHPDSIVGSWNLSSLVDYAYCIRQRYNDLSQIYPTYQNYQFKKYWAILQCIFKEIKKISRKEQIGCADRIQEEIVPFVSKYHRELTRLSGMGKYGQKELNLFLRGIRYYRVWQPKVDWIYKTYKTLKWRIKEKTPLKKIFVCREFRRHRLYKLLTDERANPLIVIFGGADYDNLGDQAISYAQIQWLQQKFPLSNIVEVFEPEIQKYTKQIRKHLQKRDILVLQGGGNLGDLYPWFEKSRRSLIKALRKYALTIFPQTAYYTDQHQLEISRKTFKKCKKLTIVAREQISFNFLTNQFNNTVMLCPDIVMALTPKLPSEKREGVLLCIRHDPESILTNADILEIRKCCLRHWNKCSLTDTVAGANVRSGEREQYLYQKWGEFKKASLVVTDRLHGMIFAALTGTPCIVFDNINHKIKSSYHWLNDLNYVQFIDNMKQLSSTVEQFANMEQEGGWTYNNTALQPYYDKLYASLQEQAKTAK